MRVFLPATGLVMLLVLPSILRADLMSVEDLSIVRRATTQHMRDMATYRAEEVYELLQKNLQRMQELQGLTDPHVNIDPLTRAKEFAALLGLMRDDYARVAAMRDDIGKEMESKLEAMGSIIQQATPYIQELETKKRDLQHEVEILPAIEDGEKREIRKRSLHSQQDLLALELKTWQKFLTNQRELLKRAGELRKVIDKFIFVLNENAQVYDRAYKVAKAHENLHEVMSYLYNDMEKINQITDELIKSWTKLQVTIDDLLQNNVVVGQGTN